MQIQNEGFDEQLQKLAVEAMQYPDQGPQRQRILNKLVKKIWHSNSLGHPQRGLWSPDLYEDLYNEALQKTLLEICQKIDRYNPEYPVMAWVNFLLSKRFQDVVKQWCSTKGGSTTSLDELDNLPSDGLNPEAHLESEMLWQFLKEDPENRLKEHIRDHPEATFQHMAIARLEEKTWEEISAELNNLSIQTLCCFFNRQLRRLMPYFQKYLR